MGEVYENSFAFELKCGLENVVSKRLTTVRTARLKIQRLRDKSTYASDEVKTLLCKERWKGWTRPEEGEGDGKRRALDGNYLTAFNEVGHR